MLCCLSLFREDFAVQDLGVWFLPFNLDVFLTVSDATWAATLSAEAVVVCDIVLDVITCDDVVAEGNEVWNKWREEEDFSRVKLLDKAEAVWVVSETVDWELRRGSWVTVLAEIDSASEQKTNIMKH